MLSHPVAGSERRHDLEARSHSVTLAGFHSGSAGIAQIATPANRAIPCTNGSLVLQFSDAIGLAPILADVFEDLAAGNPG